MRKFINLSKYLILCGTTIFIIIALFKVLGNTSQIGFTINNINKQFSNENNISTAAEVKNKNAKTQAQPNQVIEKNTESSSDEKGKISKVIEKEKTNSSIIPEKEPETFFLTYKEIVSLKSISFRDKLFCMTILSKMKRSDISRILSLASGGVTSTEAIELRKVLENSLSQKDIKKIYNVLNRNIERVYGKALASK